MGFDGDKFFVSVNVVYCGTKLGRVAEGYSVAPENAKASENAERNIFSRGWAYTRQKTGRLTSIRLLPK